MKDFGVSIEQLAGLRVQDEQGVATALADLWTARPTALVFIRHFG